MDALNPEAQINFKNIIYEGSGNLWKQALHNPASMVNWIIVNPANQFDQVAKHLTPAFNAQFTRDIEELVGLASITAMDWSIQHDQYPVTWSMNTVSVLMSIERRKRIS